MRKILCILILTGCQTVKTIETTVDNYSDGKLKTVTQKIIKKNKEFELHDNFKIDKTVIREYYRNGQLKIKTTTVMHAGMDFPCREALYELSQFDSTGKKRLYIKNECDCHKQKEITYNEKGKILTRWKKEIKRLY